MRNTPQYLLALTILAGAAASQDRPNVVLVMADDMGYTDIGCYGSEIATPTLDELAANGVRFTQFYNTSRCCPTRAALLTGLYNHQTGIGLMTGDRGWDSYRGDLNSSCVTLAEVLRGAGYATYMSGKWHVTRHTKPEGPKHNWPLQRGFDRFYGTIIGAGSFFDPATLCRDNTYVTPENDAEYQPEVWYYTDAISDNAVRYMREHHEAREDEPFFLYVGYMTAHRPMHALEEDVQPYEGSYDGGWDPIREARLARARELGVLEERWKLSPARVDWEKHAHKQWDIRSMEVYAAMITRMDRGIAKITAELERQGRLDNTLLIYLQDNGGCSEGFGRSSNLDRAEDHGFEPLGKDGLQTKIWPPMQTRDGRWVRTGPEVMAGPEDTFIAYGTGWANASNTPFRGFKHDAYEGGISTPFIVHWPAKIPATRRGGLAHDPSHLIDVMPTLVAACGATYPEEYADTPIQPMEGIDLEPAIGGGALERRLPLCFEHHGNLALRDGRWKIVSQHRSKQPRTWELYDIEADRTELEDVSDREPERKREMIAAFELWAERVGARDWPFENKR